MSRPPCEGREAAVANPELDESDAWTESPSFRAGHSSGQCEAGQREAPIRGPDNK